MVIVSALAVLVFGFQTFPITTAVVLNTFIAYFGFVIVSYTEDDVLRALHHTEWRTGMEILRRIARAKKVAEWRMNAGNVYILLESLKEKQLVERRLRDISPAEFVMRGRIPKSEFRLKGEGLRKKIELEAVSTGTEEPAEGEV